jgi:hypothetical protein
MSLTGLKITNHYTVQEGGVTTGQAGLLDGYRYETAGFFPRHYMIRVSALDSVYDENGQFGNYRICAANLTISGKSYSPPNDFFNPGSHYDIGRATIQGIAGSTGYGQDFLWLMNNPPTLPFETAPLWNLNTDLQSPWYGYGTTDPSMGGPGTKPRYNSSPWINFMLNYSGTNSSLLNVQQLYIENGAAINNSLDKIHSWTWFDTIGEAPGVPGLGEWGNEVIFIVQLKPNVVIPEIVGEITPGQADPYPIALELLSDIDGDGTFIPYTASGMMANPIIPFDAGLDIHGANVTITTTAETGTSVVQETIDGGFTTQKENLKLSGAVQKNKATKLVSIKIEADSGYYLPKNPNFKTVLNDNISMVIKSKTKSSGKVNSYTVDIIYKNSSKTSTSNSVYGEITCLSDIVYSRPLQIDSFQVNDSYIPSDGCDRKITITGKPGAIFGIAINENILDIETDVVTGEERKIYQKGNDNSILSSNNISGKYDYGYGKELPVLKGTINSSGVYTFIQKFPSTDVVKTQTAAAETTTRDINVDDASKVVKYDKMYTRQLTNVKAPIVDSINTSTNVVTVDDHITIADNSPLVFKRNKQYSVDLIPDLTSTLGPRIRTVIPTFTINQYCKPTLIVKLSEGSGSSFTITSFNDVATGLSAGQSYSYYFSDVEAGSNANKIISFKYLVTCSASITAVTMPIFNNTIQSSSSWTNSIPKYNNGTRVSVSNFQNTATGSTTITLTFDLKVERMGTSNVTMELDLDNVLTHA